MSQGFGGFNTVTLDPGGNVRNNATENNQGVFDSVPVDSGRDMSAYKIPPVIWIFVFLIGGYLGIRYLMED